MGTVTVANDTVVEIGDDLIRLRRPGQKWGDYPPGNDYVGPFNREDAALVGTALLMWSNLAPESLIQEFVGKALTERREAALRG